MSLFSVRRPIDFDGTNQHTCSQAVNLGYIISHIGDENYRNNINSSLTLTGIKPGSTISLYILYKDLRNEQTCDDHLTLLNGEQRLTICGSERKQMWNIVLIQSWLKFAFVTNEQFVGEGFLLEYHCE